MTSLVYPTLRGLDDFSDDLFSSLSPSSKRKSNRWLPALDIVESEGGYDVHMDVPGVPIENIEVTLDEGVLKIEGRRESVHEDKKEGRFYRRFERKFGSFARTLRLPVKAESEDITARVNNGVLVISIKKPEEIKPKRIEIHSQNH